MKSIYRYIVLIILLLGLTLLFLFLPTYRFTLAIVIGLTYFLWGIMVHWLDHDLHLMVALEYLALSVLAVAMLIFLSPRA